MQKNVETQKKGRIQSRCTPPLPLKDRQGQTCLNRRLCFYMKCQKVTETAAKLMCLGLCLCLYTATRVQTA